MALPRPVRRLLLAIPFLWTLYLLLLFLRNPSAPSASPAPPRSPTPVPLLRGQSVFAPTRHLRKHLVLAATSDTDTKWLQFLPGWLGMGYEVRIAPPGNNGNEAGVYLDWIIENHERIQQRQVEEAGGTQQREGVLVFAHAHDQSWHNNDFQFHTLEVSLRELNYALVPEVAFVNLRCDPNPGCPAWIRPHRTPADAGPVPEAEEFFADAWRELGLGEKAPNVIAAACCAQFAVSETAVLRNKKEVYLRWRQWLDMKAADGMEDKDSGRIMEYLWHVLFTGEAKRCVEQEECVCRHYGACFEEGGWDRWKVMRSEVVAMEERLKRGDEEEEEEEGAVGQRFLRGEIDKREAVLKGWIDGARERGRRLIVEGKFG